MSQKTKTIRFGNNKGVLIVHKKWIKSIKKRINNYGSYDIMSKYYKFLNKKNLNELKSENLLFRVNNFGKRFILFLTRFNNKNYSIFINSKTYVMTMSKFRFVNELFDGTLLIGSYLKKDDNKWSYIVNDICYYKNEDIITKPFNDRYKIMEHLINNEFENDNNFRSCYIVLSK